MAEARWRRRDVVAGLLGVGAVGLPRLTARAAESGVPTADPAAALRLDWTGTLPWGRVVDVTSVKGDSWDQRFAAAQAMVERAGGGVVYFPRGAYIFSDSLRLKSGVVIRGADPKVVTRAQHNRYGLPTRFEFPNYKPAFEGDGTPIDTAFKGIYLQDPARASNVGVVNVAINRGHIHLDEGDGHACGGNRLVFGCILTNAAAADSRVPQVKYGQHAWQRFTQRHFAAIDVKSAQNLLIANCRLPQSGDDNFTMKGYRLRESRKTVPVYDVVFDYDNRPGMYVNHFCVGGAGGSGDDGTPESHPYGFRKGTVIRDNYIFNTGRMGIGFCGDGVRCIDNVIRIAKDVWRPTATGVDRTYGSSTNDNRAVEMRGWRWQVEGNDYDVHRNWEAERGYLINDGEGLMHEDHCNSDLRDSRLANNRGNSYLSIYKCGPIDGLIVEGNQIASQGGNAIYVAADRNSGRQPCRNVSIVNNKTRNGGILIAGEPAANNVVKGNTHLGGGDGTIDNKANAKVEGNKGYEVKTG